MDLCNSVGVDYMFVPEVLEMYPEGYATYVTVESDMTNQLCGASRPGHFKGVATVVTKLFNIVEPDFAFFGQKDAQQVSVLKRMCKDLNSSVEIIACPIVRESDGLAMSSRNVYLSQSERQDALVLYKALSEAERLIRKGQREAIRVKNTMVEIIESVSTSKIDYVEIVSATTLKPVETITEDTLIALAVKIGKTRLIDNLNVDFL
jgi:pantoate--beta-alanine ligase